MTYRVRISVRAYFDIDDLLAWISPRAPMAAARWHASLLKTIESLDENPERFEIAEESAALGFEVRHLLFGKRPNVIRVLFTIEGDSVIVRHVRRASRDALSSDDW